MGSFSDAEFNYLTRQRRLGRLATIDAKGHLHVVPIGMWQINEELGTIDVSGHNFASSKKFRNVLATPRAAFVVDDLASVDPWRPRSVMIEGPAQALNNDGSSNAQGVIRITPETIVSWGLD